MIINGDRAHECHAAREQERQLVLTAARLAVLNALEMLGERRHMASSACYSIAELQELADALEDPQARHAQLVCQRAARALRWMAEGVR